MLDEWVNGVVLLVGHTISKKDNGPVKITVNGEVLEIMISWNKTSSSKVCMTIKAGKEVDILFPRTMKKFQDKIAFLENELTLAEQFIIKQKEIFLEEFKKLKGINE